MISILHNYPIWTFMLHLGLAIIYFVPIPGITATNIDEIVGSMTPEEAWEQSFWIKAFSLVLAICWPGMIAISVIAGLFSRPTEPHE